MGICVRGRSKAHTNPMYVILISIANPNPVISRGADRVYQKSIGITGLYDFGNTPTVRFSSDGFLF